MSSNLFDFLFDVNYGFGNDSVFTLIDQEELAPFPPIQDIFILLDTTPFNLLDATDLNLL